MTDNEKRAHDLAVAVCIEVCHLKYNAQISANKTNIELDYFAEYEKAYEATLDALNRKYPSGK